MSATARSTSALLDGPLHALPQADRRQVVAVQQRRVRDAVAHASRLVAQVADGAKVVQQWPVAARVVEEDDPAGAGGLKP